MRIEGQRLTVGVAREIPLLLQAQQHAVVVVRVGAAAAGAHDGAIVLLGFGPVAARVRREQSGWRAPGPAAGRARARPRARQSRRRYRPHRRASRRAAESRRRPLAGSVTVASTGSAQRRPARTVSFVQRQRRSRLVACGRALDTTAPARSARRPSSGKSVTARSKCAMAASCCCCGRRDSPEPDFGGRSRGWLADQRGEERSCSQRARRIRAALRRA